MPFTYSPEYREMVLAQTRAGRLASELAAELEVSEATIHRWVAQDKIDSGHLDGLSSADRAELVAARSRIAALEAELAATRLASDLFAKDRVMRPKEIYPIVAKLGAAGHGLKASCRVLHVAPSGSSDGNSSPRRTERHDERY